MVDQPLYLHRVFLHPPVKNEDTTFRPGLNVIWAEPDESGSANSVGKTTLVDLIDYGLGKTEFIPKDKFDLLARIHNRTLVMQFSCNGTQYTLRRDVLPGDTCMVWEGWHDEEQDRSRAVLTGTLEQYKLFLETAIWQGRNRTFESTKTSIRQIFDLLIRDQKHGFTALNKARPAVLVKTTETRLAFLLGFMSPERVRMQREYDEAAKLVKEHQSTPKVLGKFLESQKVGENELRWVLGPKEKELEGLLRQRSTVLSQDEQPQSDLGPATIRVTEVRKALENVVGSVLVAEARALQYACARSEALTEIDKLSDLALALATFSPIAVTMCPLCKGTVTPELVNQLPPECPLHNRHSPEITNSEVSQRQLVLEFEVDDLSQALEQLQGIINAQRTEQATLNENLRGAQSVVTELSRPDTDVLRAIDDRIREVEAEISSFRSTRELYNRRDELIKDLRGYRSRRQLASKRLEELKHSEKSRRMDFAFLYHSVVSKLYVEQRRGLMDLNTLQPDIHMGRHDAGQDTGAAALPIATVAFDLALLEYGLRFNESEHPRLLIHDSPALFEIDPNVYSRVFDWRFRRKKNLLARRHFSI